MRTTKPRAAKLQTAKALHRRKFWAAVGKRRQNYVRPPSSDESDSDADSEAGSKADSEADGDAENDEESSREPLKKPVKKGGEAPAIDQT